MRAENLALEKHWKPGASWIKKDCMLWSELGDTSTSESWAPQRGDGRCGGSESADLSMSLKESKKRMTGVLRSGPLGDQLRSRNARMSASVGSRQSGKSRRALGLEFRKHREMWCCGAVRCCCVSSVPVIFDYCVGKELEMSCVAHCLHEVCVCAHRLVALSGPGGEGVARM